MPQTRLALDIVGRGNWGSSLAAALPAARVIARADWPRWNAPQKVVWLCLPDRDLSRAARELAKRWAKNGNPARVLLHSSGALPAEVLAPVRALGTVIGSAHPWMTFPTGRPVALRGVAFALEGDADALKAARALVKRIGGKPFVLPGEGKSLYHAFGVMASPLMIAHLEAAQRIAEGAGLEAAVAKGLLATLTAATLDNWRKRGPRESFSGPIARGDAETMAGHAASLTGMPERDIYLALARYAALRLPAKRVRALLAALDVSNAGKGSR